MPNVQALRNKLGFVFLAIASLGPALAQDSIPAAGAAQIRALLLEKLNRTPAQEKLDSQILYNARLAAGRRIAPGVPDSFRPAVLERSSAGLIHVDIDADVNAGLLAAITALGGRVELALGQYKSVRGWVPLSAAEILAGRSDVHFVKPAERGRTNPFMRPSARQEGIRAQLARALPAFLPLRSTPNAGPIPSTGPDTNGVKAHGADLVQAAGIGGAGVKIGVLSDGVTSLATEQAAGRLPAGVTVLAGQSGDGPGPCPGKNCPDEGTAMLEIVYSMAPQAQLYFATGNTGQAQFAANIVALQAAGCNIIVDDLTYFSESVFQDGTVARAVNTVTAAGALYFSAAANSGNLDSGTSGTWEGDFNPDGAAPAITETGAVHSFGATDYETLTSKGGAYLIQWSDPFGGACDDYDLFILDPTGTSVEGASTNRQTCSQDPIESINDSASIVVNSRIVIVRFSGATRALHLDTERGRISIGTAGNTFGHNAAARTLTVAAADVATAGGGIFTGGTANPPESFSSDGPRKIFFDPSGTAITPGNFLFGTNGGTTLAKVDFTAGNGVTTGVPGFIPFFGTSAAAPHAAAIAALILSANPSLTPAQVKNILYTTSLNVSNFMSRTVGSGIVMANLAVANVVAFPTITKSFGAPSVPLLGSTSLSFSVTNPATNSVSVSGIGFADALPAGLVVSTPNGLTGTCGGGTITATAGSGSVSLTGATLAPGSTCTFSVNVTGIAAGVQSNSVTVTSPLGSGNTSTASVSVIAPPSITKTFTPNKFIPGGTTTVSFSVTNPNSFAMLTGVAFTDTLPSALVVATPNGLTSTCGGTATANAGSGTISLSGGSIAASATCTVSATVTAPEGIYLNSVQVTSSNGGTGNTSTATVYVATPPNLSKVFGEVSINPKSSTTLSFTLNNPNHSVTLDGLTFSDTLPAGLVISTPNGLTGSCGGGTIIAPAGNNLITVGGATLAPQASCNFSVNVTSDGTVLGLVTNTTSTVTSNEALPGATASATLFIGDPFQVRYGTNLNIGESYIDISNTGTNGAQLLGPGFGAASGNICVNVYAFDPGEELISCCSCLITPGQTVNLGVNRDLTAKTLTGVVPTSVTVKLLSTLAGGPGSGGSGTTCTNSAAGLSPAAIAAGMEAFGTTLHATPGGDYATTETRFISATLSAGELASLNGRCASIIGNGSTFGICASCRAGALGGERF